MHFAAKMGRLGTESAFEVLARARALETQGREIIHLEIGEPDFDTPSNIVQTGIEALRKGHTHYTPSAGIAELRTAVAQEVARTRDITVDPQEVVITPGAKPVMFFSLLALCQEGDEVIYPDPGFPIYESMINFVGAEPVSLRLREEDDFRIDRDGFPALLSPRTRLIILNSPQNPTGSVLGKEDLEVIAQGAVETQALVLSDEIYSRILYDGEHRSIAALPGMKERTIILDGFSKTYAMTGWRLGYGVMPQELAEQMAKLMVNSTSCTAAFTQWAGIEALIGPQDAVEEMVAAFRERRKVIVEGLNSIPGFRCRPPRGAFYAFPNIQGTGLGSVEMQDYLLERAGVATLAGTSFGAHGEGFLRLSYANSVPNIQEALQRIKEAVDEL
jgi:aspartate/methionine/tyrosine aminotransferase